MRCHRHLVGSVPDPIPKGTTVSVSCTRPTKVWPRLAPEPPRPASARAGNSVSGRAETWRALPSTRDLAGPLPHLLAADSAGAVRESLLPEGTSFSATALSASCLLSVISMTSARQDDTWHRTTHQNISSRR